MKKTLLIFITILISFVSQAQVPSEIEGINYQGIARDENGVALKDTPIDIEFTFMSSSNSNLLTETHSGIQTNQFGLFTLIIGSINAGTLTNSIWEQATKIKVRADLGDGWEDIDEVSLTAVPYAFKVKYEGQKLNLENGWLSITDGNGLRLADSVQLGTGGGTDDQQLSISNDTIYLEDGGFVKLPASSGSNSDSDWLTPSGAVSSSISDDIYTNGKVGINIGSNSTPSAQLEIRNSTQNDALNINDGSNSLLLIKGTGNIGIGVYNPTANLDVFGQIKMRAGASNGLIPVSDANGLMTWTAPSTVFTEVDGSVTNEIQDLSLTNNSLSLTNGGTTTIDLSSYLDNTDSQSLSITGNSLSITGANSITLPFNDTWLKNSNYIYNNYNHNSNSNTRYTRVLGDNSQVTDIRNNTNPFEVYYDGQARALSIDNNGKVVIGDVDSWNDQTRIEVSPASDQINLLVSPVYIEAKLGIGTANPTELLYLKSNDSDVDLETNDASQSSSVHFKRSGGTPNSPTVINDGQYFGNISFQGFTSGNNFRTAARIEGSTDGVQSSSQTNGKLAFHTTFGSIEFERMRITNDGNIGIGTTLPIHRLSVLSSSTNYIAKMENTSINGKGLLISLKPNSTRIALEASDGTNGLVLKGNGDTEFRLASNQTFKVLGGNVGIGTTSPNEKLDVEGSVEIDGEYNYESSKIRFASVSGHSFNAGSHQFNAGAITNFQTIKNNNAYIYFSNLTTGTGINDFPTATSSLNLPNGSILQDVTVYFYDNYASYSPKFELIRVNLLDGNSTSVGSFGGAVVSSTASQSITFTTSSLFSNIDNTRYAYYLKFTGKRAALKNIRLYGMSIKYTVTRAD